VKAVDYHFFMINKDVVKNMGERYKNVPPLIFHRSASYAKTPGELFDILESIPNTFPLIWDEKTRTWTTVENIFKTSK
jgi:hypothetical protein